MDTNALTPYPASASEAERLCSGYGQCPLAQCILCCAGIILFVWCPRAVRSTLSEVNYQLESRMRENRLSGSEGGGTIVLPTPISFRAIRRFGSLNLHSISQAVANRQDLCAQLSMINKVLVEFAQRFG